MNRSRYIRYLGGIKWRVQHSAILVDFRDIIVANQFHNMLDGARRRCHAAIAPAYGPNM
ncbi:hypothetical protein M527_01155 [Sphingobium indicum IP26]|nr:hypothetical protein M527_01155 [Sphingobium indicum IP26]